MNRTIWIIQTAATAVAACLPGASAAESGGTHRLGDHIWECRFHSDALAGSAQYTLFLPASFRPGPRAPLVLLLHGAGRNSRSLFEDAETRGILLHAPFATVMPDGKMGWWIDSPVIESSRFETLIGEVLADAERRFPVGGKPALRGLAGWSMGGFGCIRYAERHPGEFCGAASMIGLLDWPNPAFPKRWNHAVPALFGTNPEQFNPIFHAENLRGLRILLVTGDRSFDFRMNRSFHRRLETLRISHDYRVLAGQGHSFQCVRKALLAVVDFYRTVFKAGP